MAFTRSELPPLFQRILDEIERNGGTMNTEEFKRLFYYLRIDNKDIKDMTRWLKDQGYIKVNHEYQKETISLTT